MKIKTGIHLVVEPVSFYRKKSEGENPRHQAQ